MRQLSFGELKDILISKNDSEYFFKRKVLARLILKERLNAIESYRKLQEQVKK